MMKRFHQHRGPKFGRTAKFVFYARDTPAHYSYRYRYRYKIVDTR